MLSGRNTLLPASAFSSWTNAPIVYSCSRVIAGYSQKAAVALYTSAWIEISMICVYVSCVVVALYTSAWIEIKMLLNNPEAKKVALYTSAWIEICIIEERI